MLVFKRCRQGCLKRINLAWEIRRISRWNHGVVFLSFELHWNNRRRYFGQNDVMESPDNRDPEWPTLFRNFIKLNFKHRLYGIICDDRYEITLIFNTVYYPSVLIQFKACPAYNTAVGASRAGGCRANFWISRKIMSVALGPIRIF